MTQKTPALKIRITAAAESAVRSEHPWIFSDSILKQNREGSSGEYAIAYDRENEFLAIGLYDPHSPIRVRILHAGKPATLDDAWWQNSLDETVMRRHHLSTPDTTGFRYCNGESDGWPGLVLDRYETTLVLKLYSSAWFPLLSRILEWVKSRLHPERIVLRLSRNIAALAAERLLSDGQIVFGPPILGPLTFREHGLLFHVDVVKGQKTGFFLDQRENRRKVAALSNQKDVLNVFSFAGGFSLHAAAGGARSATDLDISRHALDQAKLNFQTNQPHPLVAQCRHETIQADAFEWLGASQPLSYDLIVLDPPSLAKRETERSAAISAYGHLATSALNILRQKGVLVAASCSAHVTAEEFFDAIREAARKSKRGFLELETTGHPADHPCTFREARYLKCIYLRMDT